MYQYDPKEFLLPLVLFRDRETQHILRVDYNGGTSTLLDILSVLRDLRVKIISAIVSPQTSNVKEAYIVLYVDLDNAKVDSLDSLVDKLESVKGVLGVEKCKTVYQNIIVNTLVKPMITAGERAIVNHARGIAKVLEYLYSRFPVGGKALVYYLGYIAGTKLVDFAKKISDVSNPHTLLELSLSILQTLGYGEFEIEKYSEEEGKVRVVVDVRDSMECEVVKGVKSKPYSQLIRGVLAGVVSRIFIGRKITCNEVKCIAIGNPYCQFVIEGK